METAIEEQLEAIYGSERALTIAARVRQLITKYSQYQSSEASAHVALPLTQRDALLITYGDQVCAEGATPLQTLAAFCEQHLRGVVSGVHILPFYPFTSDDGFSVSDFMAVNPALGDWDDVRRLAQSFDLMFDAVFNHMSAESEWFQKFLADDESCRDFFVSVEDDLDLSQVIRPRALPLLTEFQSKSGAKKVWTTFSADQVDLNFRNPEVLMALLEVLLFYVSQGAKFIRLDAIALSLEGNRHHLPALAADASHHPSHARCARRGRARRDAHHRDKRAARGQHFLFRRRHERGASRL